MADGLNKVGEPYTPPLPVEEEVPAEDNTIAAQTGDSLKTIAERHGVALKEVLAANPELKNPDLIHIGDQIKLPPGVTPQAGVPDPAAACAAGVPNPELDAVLAAPGPVDAAAVATAVENGIVQRGLDPRTASPEQISSAVADMTLPYAGHPQAAAIASGANWYRNGVVPAVQGVDDARLMLVAAQEQRTIIGGTPGVAESDLNAADQMVANAQTLLTRSITAEFAIRSGPAPEATAADATTLAAAQDIIIRYGGDAAVVSAVQGALQVRDEVLQPAAPAAAPGVPTAGSGAPPAGDKPGVGLLETLSQYWNGSPEQIAAVQQGKSFLPASIPERTGFFATQVIVPPGGTAPFPSLIQTADPNVPNSPGVQNLDTLGARTGLFYVWAAGTIAGRGQNVLDAALEVFPSAGLSQFSNRVLTPFGVLAGGAGGYLSQDIQDAEAGLHVGMSGREQVGRNTTAGLVFGTTGYGGGLLGGRLATRIATQVAERIALTRVGEAAGRFLTGSTYGKITAAALKGLVGLTGGVLGGAFAGANALQLAQQTGLVDAGGAAADNVFGGGRGRLGSLSLTDIQGLTAGQRTALSTQIDQMTAGAEAAETLGTQLAEFYESDGSAEGAQIAADLRQGVAAIADGRQALGDVRTIVENGGQGTSQEAIQALTDRIANGTQTSRDIGAASTQTQDMVQRAVKDLPPGLQAVVALGEASQSEPFVDASQGAMIGSTYIPRTPTPAPGSTSAFPLSARPSPLPNPVAGRISPAGAVPSPALPSPEAAKTFPLSARPSPLPNPAAGRTIPVGTPPSPVPAAIPEPALPRANLVSRAAGALGTVARRAVLPIAAAVDVARFVESPDKWRTGVGIATGWAGAASGAAMGATVGSFIPIPVVGTAAGALVGGAIGYIAGSGLGEAAVDGARNLWNSVFG